MTECGICHDPYPATVRSTYENGQVVDLGCDRCLGIQPTIHDVYFRHPYKSKALDVEFTSKAQKARYLKEHGLSEAGDRDMSSKSWVDGTREYRKSQFDKDRPVIREIWRQYRDSVRNRR